jgi:hypothetical protein
MFAHADSWGRRRHRLDLAEALRDLDLAQYSAACRTPARCAPASRAPMHAFRSNPQCAWAAVAAPGHVLAKLTVGGDL